jgi:hypothetical protein
MTWTVLLKTSTLRMTFQGMVFLLIISDLDSVAEARHAENDGSRHGFLVIISDLENVAKAWHAQNDGSGHDFLVIIYDLESVAEARHT